MSRDLAFSEAKEYRVRWQRKGLVKRNKLYQTEAGAEDFASFLRHADDERDGVPYLEDPERDSFANIPELIFGPIIESRAVSEWAAQEPTP